MKKKLLIVCIFFALLALVSGITFMYSYEKTEFLLNTYVTLSIKGFGSKKAADECFEKIRSFEKKCSVYIENSDISNLNKSGGKALDSEEADLIKRACEYSKITDGAFDITVKPLTDLWNIKNFTRVPSDDEILKTMPKIGYENIKISDSFVRLENGAQIDFGGIAKGYLADRCAEIMQKYRIESAVLDLGGNIYAVGKKDIKIGLQNPNGARGEYFGYIEGNNISVTTSGGYERFAEFNGKKYHHIISPFDGKCAESGVISATVCGKNSEECDALATAICVLGTDKGLEIINSQKGAECVIVDENNRVYTSDGINFKITNDDFVRGN